MKTSNSKYLKYSIGILFLLITFLIVCYCLIYFKSFGKTYDDIAEIPHNKYGLLLATSPIAPSGNRNFYFDDRVNAAADLYKNGKIEYIIVSGGDYRKPGKYGYDEPEALHDSLMKYGIPSDRIIKDYDGQRTIYSIQNVKDKYGIDSVTLISQPFHNERALYLADHFGVKAIAFNANERVKGRLRLKNHLREIFARPKMFWDVITLKKTNTHEEHSSTKISKTDNRTVEIIDTLNLRIYYPDYSKIDLVCGNMPSKDDEAVIMFAEAAFTGEYLDEFKHSNIAGDHVSDGKRQKGYKCKRNSGAFVYYNDKPKFLYKDYSNEFDKADENGGCGFAQEMMIHNGRVVPHTRPDNNLNEFRALCLIKGKLAIADSKDRVKFGEFIKNLQRAGASEALYLDMGPGWNYSWYRDDTGKPIEIHSLPTKYATNWITFYR